MIKITMMMMIPILVTLVGILTVVSAEHASKAKPPNNRVSMMMIAVLAGG